MAIQDSKLIKLKELFLSGEEMSVSEICEVLKINRSRTYDYLKLLQDEGFDIISFKNGRTAIYKYCGEKDTIIYKPLSVNDCLKFKILMILSIERPMVAIDILRHLNKYGDEIAYEFDNYSEVANGTFYNVIHEMIEDGLLFVNPKSVRGKVQNLLYPAGLKNSLIVLMDLEGIQNLSGAVSNAQVQGKALKSLYEKYLILTGQDSDSAKNEEYFIHYGRGYSIDSLLNDYYRLLIENSFTTKILSFTYKGKKMRFATGMAVYSQDKDMLYLIGRTNKHQYAPVRFSEIEDLTCLDEPNNEYDKPRYSEYLRDMFSISTEAPQQVEVHFDPTPVNRMRLDKLCRLRVNARLEIKPGKLIYTDKISGISDFANYLRGYGNSFKIIGPQSLINSTNNTLNRTLKRYMGESNE